MNRLTVFCPCTGWAFMIKLSLNRISYELLIFSFKKLVEDVGYCISHYWIYWLSSGVAAILHTYYNLTCALEIFLSCDCFSSISEYLWVHVTPVLHLFWIGILKYYHSCVQLQLVELCEYLSCKHECMYHVIVFNMKARINLK